MTYKHYFWIEFHWVAIDLFMSLSTLEDLRERGDYGEWYDFELVHIQEYNLINAFSHFLLMAYAYEHGLLSYPE